MRNRHRSIGIRKHLRHLSGKYAGTARPLQAGRGIVAIATQPERAQVWLWLSILGSLSIGVCLPATADGQSWSSKFDTTLDFSLHGQSGRLKIPAPAIATPSAEDDGGGKSGSSGPGLNTSAAGASVRGNLSLHGVRFGIALGLFRITRPATIADPTPRRGMSFAGETFLAYAYGRDIRPYVEIRGMWSAAALDAVDPASARGTSHALAFGFRAGILIALNEYFFLDVSAARTIAGSGHSDMSVGLGIPIPLDNL